MNLLQDIHHSEVDTTVRLFDNETAVIGGLTSGNQEQQNVALPHGPKPMPTGYSQNRDRYSLKVHIVNDDDTSRSRHSRRAYNRRSRGHYIVIFESDKQFFINPDPELYCQLPSHEESFRTVMWSIEQGELITKIPGKDIGAGKHWQPGKVVGGP